jgi:hypothetical protein
MKTCRIGKVTAELERVMDAKRVESLMQRGNMQSFPSGNGCEWDACALEGLARVSVCGAATLFALGEGLSSWVPGVATRRKRPVN